MDLQNKSVVVAGAGVMGASIAQVYAKAGFSVTLYDLTEACLERGRSLISLNQETMVREGLLSQPQSDALRARIRYTCCKDCFATAFLIAESIVEKLSVKHDFWKEVSAMAREDAWLLTNTSGLSITRIAEAVEHPHRFAGQHWLNPPHLIPLCELIKGDLTAPETMAALVEITEYLGKKPVVLNKDIPGFIINRLQFSILREALNIVESGAAGLEDVDNVMKYGLGMRYACLGPFETADLGGLDTFDHISGYLFADLSDKKGADEMLHSLVAAGALGVKSQKGFYDYADGKDVETIRRRDEMFIKLAKCLYN